MDPVTTTLPFPFYRDTRVITYRESDGSYAGYDVEDTWVPGTRREMADMERVDLTADGLGTMTLTVVSVHKPGKYPTRVFYTRRFTDPDGKTFGKGRLRITTKSAFNQLARGYRLPHNLVQP